MWLNFRADRAKQILRSIANQDFTDFKTEAMPNLKAYSFYEIDKGLNVNYLFDQDIVTNSLGKYFSELGLTQARIAETEKFAHVTYFFDGLYKGNLASCDKVLVPSPEVSTYDEAPKMSANEVCKKACNAMNKDYDFILVNFANPDMVGHTGNMEATIEALEEVDKFLYAFLTC
jgi:2,3-bisphosphoglycerate-independent phosphoglycerate mutase